MNFMQINKAKSICECLIASEGIDLKFEEAFCLFLLGLVCFYHLTLIVSAAVMKYLDILNLGFLQAAAIFFSPTFHFSARMYHIVLH